MERGPVDSSTAMLTDDRDELWDDDDLQGPSQHDVSYLLEDMAISTK